LLLLGLPIRRSIERGDAAQWSKHAAAYMNKNLYEQEFSKYRNSNNYFRLFGTAPGPDSCPVGRH
jgi:hypothetical protein